MKLELLDFEGLRANFLLQSSEHQDLKAAIANCFRTPLQVKIPGFGNRKTKLGEKWSIIPFEQSSYRNEGFLMLGEKVSGAEPGDTSNDRILAVLRVGHIARYASLLAPCYKPIIRRHSANLTVQTV